MIGNDVIDLEAAKRESNWQRRGFLVKLFTPKERELILKHNYPEVMIWLLWSMKEAAYKIYNRQTGVRAFIPHLLECSVNEDLTTGMVACGNYTYFTKSTINALYIETIAVVNEQHFNNIKVIDEPVLKDERNLPFIEVDSFKIPVSVSHHRRFKKAVALFAC